MTHLTKNINNTHWRKDDIFGKGSWEICMSAYKIMKLDPYLSPTHAHMCAQVRTHTHNSKQITNLNVKLEMPKLSEETIGSHQQKALRFTENSYPQILVHTVLWSTGCYMVDGTFL